MAAPPADKPDEFDPRKFVKAATAAARTFCRTCFEAFGSVWRAASIKPGPLDSMAERYACGKLDAVVHACRCRATSSK